MGDLRIPEEYRLGLEKLQRLDDGSFQALRTALQNEQPTLLHEDFLSHVVSMTQGIAPEDTADIVAALLALYTVRSYLELSIPDFAESVSHSDDLEISNQGRQQLEARLSEVLDLDPLLVTSKALGILIDHERGFHGARVLTDVRPIFADHAEDQPPAAVIVHTLKLTYHHGSNLEDFFIALDDGDLSRLQEVLDRAGAKAQSLKDAMEAAGIKCLATG